MTVSRHYKSILSLLITILYCGIIFSSSGANNNVLAQTTCPAGQHALTIVKVLNDNNGIASNPVFHVIDTINGVQNTMTFSPSNSQSNSQFKCLDEGDSFTIREVHDTFFSFVSVPSGTCNGQMGTSDLTCTLTNTVTSQNGGGGGFVPQTGSTFAPPSVIGTTVPEPQAAISSGSTTSQASLAGRLTNPPFQVCQGNTLPTSQDIFRLPSSGTYIIQGIVNAAQLRSALNSLQPQDQGVTIQLLSDLNPQDGNMLSISNPQFMGKFIVTSNDGTKQRVIDFNVVDVRTECKYITLARAVGHATNKNVAPLGEIGNTKTSDLQAPDIDKLLVGGNKVTSTIENKAVASVLNPPFATCVSPATDKTGPFQASTSPTGIIGDNLALYNVRGILKSPPNLGNSFILEITSDIVPPDDDLAKIVKNNNPYIKVNLLSETGKNSVNIVPFVLDDLWTDCKAVSLSTKSIFNILPGEINP
jgi:hypothetical protein